MSWSPHVFTNKNEFPIPQIIKQILEWISFVIDFLFRQNNQIV